jgi:hypothetical protein
MYKRICKKCGNEIFHKTEKLLKRAIKLDRVCYSCSNTEKAIGENNSMFGKKHTEETKLKIKEKRKKQVITEETRDKMSISHKQRLEEFNHWVGKKHSLETIEKMKLNVSKRIIDNKWHPSFNREACLKIEEYGKQYGFNFQHALNGGEFFIEELGYWVDGYDKEKNVVIEYYEPAHKYFVERDEKRINNIKEFLNCEVIILKEWELQ